jgi:mannose-1-phosphate guanylyltransferase
MKIIPVLMIGGYGTRLWPLSREQYPKQFLSLFSGGKTMLQATLQRLNGMQIEPPLLICNEEHRFLAAEQLRVLGYTNVCILLEPVARNTAPTVALAALQATKNNKDTVLLVLAADHFISDIAAFQRSVQTAISLAIAGKLVTCGVIPTRAEVGYGYIECGAPIDDTGSFKVNRFIEKPDARTAQNYIASGNFLWNSGMFVFKASRYLQELECFAPTIFQACRNAMSDAKEDLTFVRVDKTAFEACPSDSIDYAVMEKTKDAAVVPLDAGWSDVGSWSALWEVSAKDENNNVLRGDVLAYNSTDSYVHSNSRLIAAVGIKNLVIVETKDAILVADKSQTQEIKKVVDLLKAKNRSEHKNHREAYRPWGMYDSIDNGVRYQVKRITVKPGAKLSVQMHHHRAEHWIVVSGTAKITNGDKSYLLTENQSTFIPVGQIHALENPGKIPLELIEVQSGAYLEEDDIVRLEDRYGRF